MAVEKARGIISLPPSSTLNVYFAEPISLTVSRLISQLTDRTTLLLVTGMSAAPLIVLGIGALIR